MPSIWKILANLIVGCYSKENQTSEDFIKEIIGSLKDSDNTELKQLAQDLETSLDSLSSSKK